MNKQSEGSFFEDEPQIPINEKLDSAISDREFLEQNEKMVEHISALVESGKAVMDITKGPDNKIEKMTVKDSQTGEILYFENFKVLSEIEKDVEELYPNTLN